MSATEESPDELFARRCVERVEGVSLCWEDRPGRNAAVDYHINYPDGPAALEVTTLTDRLYREVASLMSEPLGVSPQRFAWRVTIGAKTSAKAARCYIPQLIEMCEAAGLCDPFDLTDQSHPAVAWYESGTTDVKGYETHRAPAVHLLPPAIGGGVRDALPALVTALNDACQNSVVRSKIKKLDASGLLGRQIFLLVDAQGLDFEAYYGLAMVEEVPTIDVQFPDSISHVWMASGFKLGGVLRWQRGVGWSRHWPFDNF